MPTLYGEHKTEKEIRLHVLNYAEAVKSFKHDRYHAIMSLIPSGGAYVLDYGCGWGHFAVAIRDKGNRVEAIDLSKNEIDICNLVWGRQLDINFSCNSITAFPDESFDLVLSNQVIEHVHNVGNYLYGINRGLKTGGQLIISLPNIMNPRYFLALLKGNMQERLKQHSEQMLTQYDKSHDHINSWDPYHLTTLMASAGFALERYIPTEGIPLRRDLYLHLSNGRLSNLSYTMTFIFSKVKSVVLGQND